MIETETMREFGGPFELADFRRQQVEGVDPQEAAAEATSNGLLGNVLKFATGVVESFEAGFVPGDPLHDRQRELLRIKFADAKRADPNLYNISLSEDENIYHQESGALVHILVRAERDKTPTQYEVAKAEEPQPYTHPISFLLA